MARIREKYIISISNGNNTTEVVRPAKRLIEDINMLTKAVSSNGLVKFDLGHDGAVIIPPKYLANSIISIEGV